MKKAKFYTWNATILIEKVLIYYVCLLAAFCINIFNNRFFYLYTTSCHSNVPIIFPYLPTPARAFSNSFIIFIHPVINSQLLYISVLVSSRSHNIFQGDAFYADKLQTSILEDSYILQAC